MSKSSTFVGRVLEGELDADAIDDLIDEWHQGGGGTPLWSFLGLTREEYGLWVENPRVLPAILEAHRGGKSVVESAHRLSEAACGDNAQEMRQLELWLTERLARTA